MATDNELLRKYAQAGSEPALKELVQRHVNMVYATALRETDANPHLTNLFLTMADHIGARESSDLGILWGDSRFEARKKELLTEKVGPILKFHETTVPSRLHAELRDAFAGSIPRC